jgi:preprotein translocase subunit SecA
MVAAQDEVVRLFASERLRMRMARPDAIASGSNGPISSRTVSKQIERAQIRVEEEHDRERHRVLDHDEALDRQRDVVYGYGQSLLVGDSLEELAREATEDRNDGASFWRDHPRLGRPSRITPWLVLRG